MDELEILVADSANENREEMAEFFRKAGYRVDTTDSAVHAFCSILEKRAPVLLLGTDFDSRIPLAELVRLLKKCNRNLSIILVSDETSLPVIRSVREEGIFYHALTPKAPEDREEIRQAVDCALGEQRLAVREQAHRNARKKREERRAAWGRGAAVAFPLAAAVAVAAGTGYLEGEPLPVVIWVFLGFCALIVASQFIPLLVELGHAAKEAGRKTANAVAAAAGKKSTTGRRYDK